VADTERFNVPADADMSPEQRRVAQAIIASPRKGIRGPFPALLRRPEMADATRLLGDCVRYGTSLSDRVREIAILVVVRHWNVHVEWASHGKIARDAGLDETVLDALEAGRRPAGLSNEEAAAYDLATELLGGKELGDKSYQAALKVFGEVGVIDLIGTIAYYNYISVIMNGIANPLAPGVKRLEPLA
jgi:4-carboxymuconolactone decarboxylase